VERPTLAGHTQPRCQSLLVGHAVTKERALAASRTRAPRPGALAPSLVWRRRAALITSILLRFVGAVESRNRRQEPDEGTGLGLTLTQCERQALIVSLEEYAHRATARLRAVARRAPARA